MPTVVKIIKGVLGYNLKNELWGRSSITMQIIINNKKEEEFMFLLKDLYPNPVDILEIHNFMCVSSEFIYKQLGIEAGD